MIVETAFVLTVLGCGNEGDSCDFVAEPEVTYVSRSECEAAVSGVLTRFENARYPVLVGTCSAKQESIQIVEFEPEPVDPNRFDELRAKANAFEFDPLVTARSWVERTGDATKDAFVRIRNLVSSQ